MRRGFAGVAAGPAWRPADAEWDATLEEVSLGELLRDETAWLNGWTSPPWLKEGWFHAHALSARAVTDPSSRTAIEEMFARRVRGDYASAVDRLNLERRLVSLVTRGCERVPIGYAVRREAVVHQQLATGHPVVERFRCPRQRRVEGKLAHNPERLIGTLLEEC